MSGLQNFTDGQEVVFEDLNSLQTRGNRFLLDKVIYELLQRNTDGFFGDAMTMIRQNATQVLIKAGLGYMLDDTGTKFPTMKPLSLEVDTNLTVDPADNANPRIDVIAVKWKIEDNESESRNVKDELTSTIAPEIIVVSKKWSLEVSYTAGIPAGSPVAPATPAGYIKIGEILVSASVGIVAQSDVSDSRKLLPLCTSSSATGSSEYDAVVGNITQVGVTHADIKTALDNALDGWKILVLENQEIDSVPTVSNNNIEIVFKRGASLTKGTSTQGLIIAGEDCKLTNSRCSGFSTVSDVAIEVQATAKRCVLDSPRFLNCDTNVQDDGPETFINVEYTE